MIQAFLESRGHTVKSAGDVLQLFRLVEGQTPDLLILDMKMPGGGGPGAVKFLAETPRTVKTPIIILSVMPVDEQRKHFASVDHIRFFSKRSLELEELGAVVDALVKKP
jgi:CheY-like chemotaxis protein